MDAREQAEKQAEALMAAATDEQRRVAEESTRPLVRMYPGLADVPPMERLAVLSKARDAVSASPISKSFLVLITLALAAAAALAITSHWSEAVAMFAGSMLTAIARQVVDIALTRRHLSDARARK